MPSFIRIRPTVWPQYTNVTDRTGKTGQTDRQRSDSIERTVLQAVSQKLSVRGSNRLLFVLEAVDQVINETIAYDKIHVITVWHCNIYLAFKILIKPCSPL